MIRDRVISAVFIAVVLISAVLWLPAPWSVAALSVVLLLAAWEWATLIARQRLLPRLLFMGAAVLLCALWWQLATSARGLRAVLWAAAAAWCIATAWVFALPQHGRPAVMAVWGLFSLSFAWLALARMRLDWQDGGYVVLYTLLIVWLADSGAYFAGRAWGRRKLAPKVSPGKTWEGLLGGCAACVVLALVTASVLDLPLLPLLVATLVAGLFSVVGDLTESLAKRHAGVKDSGTLIPGHGGVLDRFDSLLAAAPLLLLGLELLPGLRT